MTIQEFINQKVEVKQRDNDSFYVLAKMTIILDDGVPVNYTMPTSFNFYNLAKDCIRDYTAKEVFICSLSTKVISVIHWKDGKTKVIGIPFNTSTGKMMHQFKNTPMLDRVKSNFTKCMEGKQW